MQTQTQRCEFEGGKGIMYEAYIVYNEQVVRAVIGGPYDGVCELKGESNEGGTSRGQEAGGKRVLDSRSCQRAKSRDAHFVPFWIGPWLPP